MKQTAMRRLADVSPELERILVHNVVDSAVSWLPSDIICETTYVRARDGIRLATDVYRPPVLSGPVIAMRTPYGRAVDGFVGLFLSLARRGYVVVSQDCRGTGGSEPSFHDHYVYELEDGYDLVDWISGQQWFDGFLGALGGSYIGQTQWCMATHPAMTTIAPQVSGLGIAFNTARLYMFLNALAHAVGKDAVRDSVPHYEMERVAEKETMAGGYFNEPLYKPLPPVVLSQFPLLRELPCAEVQHWLWERYCTMTCRERAEFLRKALDVPKFSAADGESVSTLFGHRISHDALTIPHTSTQALCRSILAPSLLITGWYDWCLNDALTTWRSLRQDAAEPVSSRTRLLITPGAHNMPGYHEGIEHHPELLNAGRYNVGLLLRWFAAVRGDMAAAWPNVIYYLMGANEWWTAGDWPVPGARPIAFFLSARGTLSPEGPQEASAPDQYTYDPTDPTPTVGGSIVSYLYPPGSVDVSEAQKRSDVLTYTSECLEDDLDVVGPLQMVLYASTSALDTDFTARLSDVFPDGRAIQLQSGILRARYHPGSEPRLLDPERVYRFEIDMWATANRFKRGHRLRIDVSSADFPRFDRNSNRGGVPGDPLPALQSIYHDPEHPSHLQAFVLEREMR